MPRSLITGITGQAGSYLAELLLKEGHEVFGLVRRSASPNYVRISGILDHIRLIVGDLSDEVSIRGAVKLVSPNFVFNAAAQSFVPTSLSQPEYTMDVNAMGVLRLLEAIRSSVGDARFIQFSSSEMFGASPPPQHENTTFYPRSPYGISKMTAFWFVKNYRESYNMWAANAILFNNEGPRRGEEFITQKIAIGVAKIKLGLEKKLYLGNLDARRDWGYCEDYMEAVYLLAKLEDPLDLIISSGESHFVREFCEEAFSCVGLRAEDYVEVSPEFIRPAEVNYLQGDSSAFRRLTGWEPKKGFTEIVREMVMASLSKLKSHQTL